MVSVGAILTYNDVKKPRKMMGMVSSFKKFPLTLFHNSRNSRLWKKGTLSNTCRWEMVTDPKLGCQKWVPDQNLAVRCGHLTETRRWDMVSDHWSPDQWTGYHLSPSCISQVTIFHRRVVVRWPLLTAKFWSGTHFWQPSFWLVTISHRHVLDRVPSFHLQLLREY